MIRVGGSLLSGRHEFGIMMDTKIMELMLRSSYDTGLFPCSMTPL